MVRQVVTRTERRMEKKQALVLLFLVLGVSLVSFVLGVMVGRGGSDQPAPVAVAEERKPVPIAAEPPPAPPADPATPPAEAAAAAEAPAPAAEKGALTFFDTLPKGEQTPLGSGINRPPETKPAEEAPAAAATGSQPAKAETRPAPAVVETPSAPAAAMPAASAQGAYVVQVASFKDAADAQGLSGKLVAKGYQAFTQQADLGDKGVWHRVMVGPFADSQAAGQVVDRLKAQEKLSGLVKKR
ncbi:hypothetical protein DESUT3_11570 [Desulfuromonas versatilis]|uniref:SPOR domain-containing protein n=1 Tax=Desulfuromonas versatilis TaxID=2802975 RepID=A0ABN6DVF3_9BACT|nr:SPOR domain-containing protein [Desulfuromonas versatilis]BCR04088.1 hypothetical protein DESUT3_11570 [Desulfuromonas versatilis]